MAPLTAARRGVQLQPGGKRSRVAMLPEKVSESGESSSDEDELGAGHGMPLSNSEDESLDEAAAGGMGHVAVGDWLDSDDSGSASEEDGQGSDAEDSDAEGHAKHDPLADLPMGARAQLLADGSGSRLAAHARAHARAGNELGSEPAPGVPMRTSRAAHGALRGEATGGHRKQGGEALHKRESKHAPVEEKISRRPVSVLRDSIQRARAHRMDPRFVELGAGQRPDDARVARKRYGFLFKEQMPAEMKKLKADMKAAKDPLAKKAIQTRISRLDQALKKVEHQEMEDEVMWDWKSKERAAVAAGKEVYHLKKADKTKLVNALKFKKLEESGGLDRYMAKRRKRSAAKDHKKLPFRAAR